MALSCHWSTTRRRLYCP